MAHNTEPRFIHFTVRPSRRFLDEWDFNTVKTLATRGEEIGAMFAEPHKLSQEEQAILLREWLAIQDLLTQIERGRVPEVH
jgi:hypothetical protein